MKEGIQASQLRITALREHLVQTFTVEFSFLGELRHSALGSATFRNASKKSSGSFPPAPHLLFFRFARIAQIRDQLCLVGLAFLHVRLP
jgi:hypothetical protein